MRYKTSQVEKVPVKAPRTKPAEVRLDELISAAEKLFLAKGIEATTINDIVELAQVAKGTFYHYFASKNELIDAMRDRYTDQFLRRLQHAVESCAPNDWLARLSMWIQTSILTYIETHKIHDIVYTHHHHYDRNNREKSAILEQLSTILSEGHKAGTWRLKRPRITALLIYAGVHGATDDIIANQAKDCIGFSHDVTSACLRLVGFSEQPDVSRRISKEK